MDAGGRSWGRWMTRVVIESGGVLVEGDKGEMRRDTG